MDPMFLLAALAIGAAVALALVGFRDPKAGEHDLSDYHDAPVNAPSLSIGRYMQLDQRPRTGNATTVRWTGQEPDEILPPAPAGMNAGSPLYAGMLFDTWHPESPSDTADRFLRELRDEARAELAGVA